MIRWPPSWTSLWLLPAIFLGFTVHELAHAFVAYLLGDTSQVERNRLSFNPLRHVSWLGVATFLLVGFGWAKPVWIDHSRFRLQNRAFGTFLVSIAGVSANLALALLAFAGMMLTWSLVLLLEGAPALTQAVSYLTITELGPDLQGAAVAFSWYMVLVNAVLGVFNLIPLPLFDGFQAIVSLVLAVKTALRRPVVATPPLPDSPAGDEPAQELSPAEIHFTIGLAYHHDGLWDEAIARYRQATEHDHNFGLAYYNLGLAYWAKGRLPLATSAFRAAAGAPDGDALRQLAGRQLAHLGRVSHDPAAEPGPPPPPLEAGPQPVSSLGTSALPALEPSVVRSVRLRLAAGAVASVALAVAAWLYVTVATLAALD